MKSPNWPRKWLPCGLVVAVLLSATGAQAGGSPLAPQVGDRYEISLARESVQKSSNGSSGSSHDKDTVIEEVTSVRADGLELQYDLPGSTPLDERSKVWQFPVRVFRPISGPLQLLNVNELEDRINGWLKAANLSRETCGHWYFTWNAFRVECDPDSVIKIVESYDLRAVDLREGGIYQDSEASGPVKLARKRSRAGGETFVAEMPVDAGLVRRARAEAEVVAGEIMKKPVSLESALQKRTEESISGTISVTFEIGPTTDVCRRTRVVNIEIKPTSGPSETQTLTETLERIRIS